MQELPISTIRNAWDNVFEDCFDQYGVVISEFEIIIALSPTYRFEEWVDYEPWRHMNLGFKIMGAHFVSRSVHSAIKPTQISRPLMRKPDDIIPKRKLNIFIVSSAKLSSEVTFDNSIEEIVRQMTDEKDKSSKTGFSFTMKDGEIKIGDESDAGERAKAREAKKAEREAKKAEREAKRAERKAERERKAAEREAKRKARKSKK